MFCWRPLPRCLIYLHTPCCYSCSWLQVRQRHLCYQETHQSNVLDRKEAFEALGNHAVLRFLVNEMEYTLFIQSGLLPILQGNCQVLLHPMPSLKVNLGRCSTGVFTCSRDILYMKINKKEKAHKLQKQKCTSKRSELKIINSSASVL